MKPIELHSPKYQEYYDNAYKKMLKKNDKIAKNRDITCGIENIEGAYKRADELLKIMLSFKIVPKYITQEYNKCLKYIKTETKAIHQECKRLKL